MNDDTPKLRVKNFHQIHDWLYRGAQPPMDSFAELKSMGVKTVVNLRWRKGPVDRERARVTELGMTFIHIPLNYWTLPNRANVDEFLEVLDKEELRPFFVHCLHGADRTGILFAMYRILRCQWSLKQAYDEMVRCGFHRLATRHFKWALWRMVAQNRERTKV